NVLVRTPEYRASQAAVKLPTGAIGEPLTRFVRLPSPSPLASPADTSLSFAKSSPTSAPAAWAGAISLDGESAPAVIVADGREAHVKSDKLPDAQTLPFPGGSAMTPPGPEGVLGLDYNYDFKTDLAFAGAGGVKLYRQQPDGRFSDVTASSIPSSTSNR